MGINTVRLKVEVFTISAFFAGVAGGLWAYTTGYVSPNDFNFANSILILAMVVVGGLGSLPGAIIGATLLILSILFLPKGIWREVFALNFVRRYLGVRSSGTLDRQEVGWR